MLWYSAKYFKPSGKLAGIVAYTFKFDDELTTFEAKPKAAFLDTYNINSNRKKYYKVTSTASQEVNFLMI